MTDPKIQFIGGIAIESIANNVVTFTDWSTQTFTPRQLEYLVTDIPNDPSKVRELLLVNITPDILAVMVEDITNDNVQSVVSKILEIIELHNVRRWDFAQVLDSVLYKFKEILDVTAQSYNEKFNEAIWKAFGTYKEGKPSQYFIEDVRVLDFKKILS